jgi:voltage-gated potassium channel Kch
MGYDFVESFKEHGSRFLAVDFDPEIVARLLDDGINVKYGDADDGEFLDEIEIDQAKIVISTIPDYETNIFLLEKTHQSENQIITVLSSRDLDEAIKLYENGADYVIVPHFIGGQIVSNLAREAVLGNKSFDEERSKHLTYLKTRKALGHTSPTSSY